MEPQKIKEFNVSRMTIEKNVISWKDHAVRLPGVVRIWVGDSPRRTFPISMVLILLMIALSGPGIVNKAVMLAVLGVYIGTHLRSGKNTDPQAGGKDHVNLELCSGMVYSFASGSESFAMELYEVLKHLMEGDASMSHCDIVFENGGEIIDQTKQEEPEKTSGVECIRGTERPNCAGIKKAVRQLYKENKYQQRSAVAYKRSSQPDREK